MCYVRQSSSHGARWCWLCVDRVVMVLGAAGRVLCETQSSHETE